MIPFEIERLLSKVQKPARYCGGEINTIVKDKTKVTTRVAFCFPDLYEVGMSHLGMKLFYSAFNKREEIWCERVFAPAEDMRSLLLENGMKLYGLESFDPLDEFDVIMFTLQYELCYTGVLDMLYLSGIPLRQKDRKGLEHLVMGGGPCACNPEPIADFFDLFFLGEGEEVDLEVLDLYGIAKKRAGAGRNFCKGLRRSRAFMCRLSMMFLTMRTERLQRLPRKTVRLRPSKNALCRILIRRISPKALWCRLLM